MTATATIDEQLVSKPDSGKIFLARRRDLRLTKTPRYPIRGASGEQVGEKPGATIQFSDGRFYCPAEGKVALEDGREVDAAEISEWLLRHKLLNDLHEGFWAVETTAPPVSQEEMQAMMDAALALDVDRLSALIEQERAGWDRAIVIETASGALERIRAVREEVRLDAERREAEESPAEEPKPAAKPARKG